MVLIRILTTVEFNLSLDLFSRGLSNRTDETVYGTWDRDSSTVYCPTLFTYLLRKDRERVETKRLILPVTSFGHRRLTRRSPLQVFPFIQRGRTFTYTLETHIERRPYDLIFDRRTTKNQKKVTGPCLLRFTVRRTKTWFTEWTEEGKGRRTKDTLLTVTIYFYVIRSMSQPTVSVTRIDDIKSQSVITI